MISLCMISRKEDEESLIRAVNSCQEYVQELIIVDTTREGQEGITAFPTVRFDWNGSFADARNFSFEHASGDVVCWIDSDDTVTNPENLPILAKSIQDGKADWIYLEYVYQRDDTGNILAKHWKSRLFRKGTGHWVGNVHEDFMPDEAVNQVKDSDLGDKRVIIEHHATQDELKEHSRRNLDIQLAELERDGEKADPRTVQYTAMSYQGLGEYEAAIPYFLRHAKITGSREDKFWSLYRTSLCLHILGRNEEALSVALDSLKTFPQWKSSYFLLAGIYSALEDWPKVIEWTLTGLEKSDPDTLQVVSEIDYTILPLGRLAEAYLHTGNYELANSTAIEAYGMNPKFQPSRELVKLCKETLELEWFVNSFLEVVSNVRKYDRTKASALFDLVPGELDDDIRIQRARGLTVPPKIWPENSVQIYCGRSIEPWAYPSKFTGIGGSEEAVINMAEQLSKKGYQVTVFNRCGDLKGNYNGVEYVPYYHFSPRDTYGSLFVWRSPEVFMRTIKARKKYLWLHDIAQPERFSQEVIDQVDKVMFLSRWHRNNLPDLPDEKCYITNNGIDPRDFEKLPPKRPNSLVWTSSYDRGLLPFLKNIWPLIRKEIPDVTMDVAYGWQNIDRELEILPHLRELKEELSPILGDPGNPQVVRMHGKSDNGIIHHGRISHIEVARLLGSSMVYPYASEFGETNNITSQKAQAAGCWVVTTSQAGGTSERVINGSTLNTSGIYTNKEDQKRFSEEVVKYLNSGNNPDGSLVQSDFSWETTANNWIKDLL